MPRSLIIDTDPGVDDALAISLALNSPECDLKLISLCFGNCDTNASLRNVETLFSVFERERVWREQQGLPSKHHVNQKPIVAVGMDTALDGTRLDATYFHGDDGLGNVHTKMPEFTSTDKNGPGYTFSDKPSYQVILDLLREEPDKSVTIAAIGPLMNIARAAQIDPDTFSRVKEIVHMGGALKVPGNVTPRAEFNCYSDPLAAAVVYSFSATEQPCVTLPPRKEFHVTLPRPVPVTIFPLDITMEHNLYENQFFTAVSDRAAAGSPLTVWSSVWLQSTFDTFRRLNVDCSDVHINMHDPLATWYAICGDEHGAWESHDQDVRVETEGQWSRGVTIEDDRGRQKTDAEAEDDGKWLGRGGNHVKVVTKAPVEVGQLLVERIYV
ncbi:Conserved hypothetical protein [Yarrowia lipolytica]|nr:Conserved hypothetical protein [Yarrowia lipolytica]